jgi:hypothetical protein
MRAAIHCVGIAFFLVFALGCSKSDPQPPKTDPHLFGSGYAAYLTGGDTVHHDLGPFELWHKGSDGKYVLVWPYLGDEARVFDDMIVFHSGLSGDKRFPALFAYTPSGMPVEITECVTEYYCRTNHVPYDSLKDNFRYVVRAGTNRQRVELLSMRTDWSPINLQSILLSIPVSEIKNWFKDGLTNGTPMKYEKVEYRAARTSPGR